VGGNLKRAPRPMWSPARGTISSSRDHDLSQNQELDAYPGEPPRCLNPPIIFIYFQIPLSCAFFSNFPPSLLISYIPYGF